MEKFLLDVKSVTECIEEIKKENTPLDGNICHDCGGKVIQKVSGWFRGMIRYSFPECENCGRVYYHAVNPEKRGEAEFLEDISRKYYKNTGKLNYV